MSHGVLAATQAFLQSSILNFITSEKIIKNFVLKTNEIKNKMHFNPKNLWKTKVLVVRSTENNCCFMLENIEELITSEQNGMNFIYALK